MQNVQSPPNEIANNILSNTYMPAKVSADCTTNIGKFIQPYNDLFKNHLDAQIKLMEECINNINTNKINKLTIQKYCSDAENVINETIAIIASRIKLLNCSILNNCKEISGLNSTYKANYGDSRYVFGTIRRYEELKGFLTRSQIEFRENNAKEEPHTSPILNDYRNHIG